MSTGVKPGQPSEPISNSSTSVEVQTDLYQSGSLMGFLQTCVSHSRQVRSMITGQRKANERMLRIKSASPEQSLLCPACKSLYDSSKRPALALPCGHAMCRDCVTSGPRARLVTCPVDSRVHLIPQDQFPTDYLLMELVEKTRNNPEFLCNDHQSACLGFCRMDSSLLCGECVLVHRTHDCLAFQSPAFLSLSESKRQSFLTTYEQCKSNQEAWMSQVAMFDMYCLQLTCTVLGNCVAWKDVMAANTGVMSWVSEEERLYKELQGVLMELRRTHYEMLEVSKERVRMLELFCKEFDRFSAAEKAVMDPGRALALLNFEVLLNEFLLVLNQANSYICPSYM